ncbi:MAG: sugar ABC transporter ATP-binding protein [Lentisphaeria bacterium]|nr:sugar ABC transporter ATP-binding protein [Lentisphaeria bacterium]
MEKSQVDTAESRKDILLQISNLQKSYSGVTVLSGITFSLEKGSVMGLIGENGAGKSTLIKCINGVTTPDSGEILFDGSFYSSMTIKKALSLGIVTIPQEFNLADHLSVKDNIYMGCELKKAHFFLDHRKMRIGAAELLESLGCILSPDAIVGTLNVAQKQMVEIARGLNRKCHLFIMDEPTTVLNTAETEKLFRVINRLKEQGVSVIYVSHKLAEISTICDHFTVLRDGQYITTQKTAGTSTKEMANLMVGRQLKDIYPPKPALPPPDAECLLSLQDVSESSLVKNVTFSLAKGEILGIAGLGGAGRTELAEGIYGIRRFISGKMFFKGKEVCITSPEEAVKAGIAYIPEDRQKSGTVQTFPLSWNMTLVSLLEKYCSGTFICRKKEESAAEKYISLFSIKAPSGRIRMNELSGGNQQKGVIAKSLDTSPDLFIFDEPTRGIDINSRSEIYFFIRSLAEKGTSCIIISSDLEEIIGLCPRTLVMREGRLAGILENDNINEKEIMYLATGIK